MTVSGTFYEFSSLAGGKSYPFVPGTDTIHFGDVSAAGLNLKEVLTGLKITVGTKFVILKATTIGDITTSNFTFTDGSQVLVGDDSPSSLFAGSGDDQL